MLSNALKSKKDKTPPGQKSNMKVVVRVRPLNVIEKSCSTQTNVIRVMDQNVLVFDPNEECERINFPGAYKRRRNHILQRRARDLKFIFDRVFDENSTTSEVFENTTKNIVDGVLDGYNCTVFAYGATGAGKTHTMLGSPSNPGVCFMTMMDLYARIEELKNDKTCDVAVSYLEVYNETIRDLLFPGQPLAVREDPKRGVCVSGLTLHKPRTAEELLGMLEFGNNNRTQHPTDANAQSSRSHAVFQVFVRQKDRTAGLQTDVRLAKMTLIDLAGSERAIVTSNRGARFREGANINKSLLALGNCINALADKENKSGHIPYRDSKLTRLLKDSLGGNCRTVMIAAISPSSLSYEDTYNTLKYADRAKSIKVKLSKNVVSVDWHVSRYAKIVNELRTEVAELKDQIKRYEEGEIVKQTPQRNSNKKELENLKVSLRNITNERIAIKKDVVDIEASQRDLLFRASKKERNIERVHLLCTEGEEREKTLLKTQKVLSVTKTKKKKLETQLRGTEQKLQSNTQALDRVKQEMTSLVASSKELEDDVINYQSHLNAELECAELRRQCRYFTKYTQAQEKETQATERLLLKVLSAYRKQYLLLHEAGLTLPNITQEHNNIVDMVTGGREVSWADQSVMETDLNISTIPLAHDASILKKKTPRASFSTPINYETTQTTSQNVAHDNEKTPRLFQESRASLLKKFDETTPSKSSCANETFTVENNPCNATFDLGSHTTFKLSNTTPLRDMNKVTPTSKLAWMDLPKRELESNTPKKFLKPELMTPLRDMPKRAISSSVSGELESNTPKKIKPELMTPLRELSVNKCKPDTRNGSHDTPSKKLKSYENTSAFRGSESKENIPQKPKQLRKITSAPQIAQNEKVQRHLSGIKRAVSSSVVGTSRKFDPRSAKEKTKPGRPRWM